MLLRSDQEKPEVDELGQAKAPTSPHISPHLLSKRLPSGCVTSSSVDTVGHLTIKQKQDENERPRCDQTGAKQPSSRGGQSEHWFGLVQWLGTGPFLRVNEGIQATSPSDLKKKPQRNHELP